MKSYVNNRLLNNQIFSFFVFIFGHSNLQLNKKASTMRNIQVLISVVILLKVCSCRAVKNDDRD